MDLLTTSSTKRTKLWSSVYFFGTAAIAGILCNLLLFRFYSSSSHHIPVDIDTVTGSLESHEQCPSLQAQLLSDPSEVQWQPLPERSVRELQDMVATTKGFYVRDWSLHLGWNNVRYILETAVLHAQLLNRTLVIPSFVYARACEYDIHTCESFAVMVNRNNATQTDEWRELPIEQQMAWRVPMEVMIDIPHLRSVQPIMFVSEYLRLRGVNAATESGPGRWEGPRYHSDHYPSHYTIYSRDYDPSEIVRVDSANPELWVPNDTIANRTNEALRKRLGDLKKPLMSLADARATISSVTQFSDSEELLTLVKNAGWQTLHTWDGALGEDLVKWVVKPRIDVAPRDNLRGFIQDYGSRTEEILYLNGEIHHHRKPGSMRFTTIESARDFASLVLHDIQATHAVQSLAARVIHRIDSLTGGRLWVAAHMRRGDFVRHGWIADKTIEGHLRRIKESVHRGDETLQHLHNVQHTTYDVPSPLDNEQLQTREPPRSDDPFYLATDERDPEAIKYLKNNGAILFKDVLSLEDRREFGWPLLLTDVVSLVEQQIMGKGAAYFCGNAWSSVAGGVVNIRAAAGWDPQTAAVN